MSFSGMWDDCDMTVEIKESSVAYVAMALFGVHIEVEFQTRHIMGAVIQTPNPTVTLCDIHEQALTNLFGPEIFQAIDTSLLRWQEREEGIRATRCVRMEVSSDPHSSALVKLKLELEQAIRIGTSLGFV
ncbi:hypothetical protein BDY21DRAFT_143929 [Lineolata rhizophorae]|uniref:Uncharacterized protein n=1 Tax=Lineolata rhizophorae TaxID=578093 RepID=A0A6A6NMX0_9PEZI|nr:hypothetical protein BDY21DRAFT_143929 [Lineolata rhizophorae]